MLVNVVVFLIIFLFVFLMLWFIMLRFHPSFSQKKAIFLSFRQSVIYTIEWCDSHICFLPRLVVLFFFLAIYIDK